MEPQEPQAGRGLKSVEYDFISPYSAFTLCRTRESGAAAMRHPRLRKRSENSVSSQTEKTLRPAIPRPPGLRAISACWCHSLTKPFIPPRFPSIAAVAYP